MDTATSDLSWVERELAGSTFGDRRLGRRLCKLVEQLSAHIGETIPLACADWANTKAAYRFLSNDDVSDAEILAGHFASTAARIAATDGPILILQDTTEFVYKRSRPETIGGLTYAPNKKNRDRLRTLRTVCGLLMHSSLALTPEGLPLGLTAVKFWSRAKFKGRNRLKHSINTTRIPIEQKESIRWLQSMEQTLAMIEDPKRCIHIGDREADIYELFCTAVALNTHFIIRTCVDRLAGNGDHTIATEMAEVEVAGEHIVKIHTLTGKVEEATLELRYKRIHVLPPIGKEKRYPPLLLTVLHAEEREPPPHRQKIVWKLVTNLAVTTPEAAVEMLRLYALRWKIEVFHKILKSGCRAEDARLRTADRLANLIAIFCVLAWRVFWMTMMNRAAPAAPPTLILTPDECTILDQRVPDRLNGASSRNTLEKYLTKVARLGGYLARSHDPPPGNIVIWRGMRRLMDISDGYNIARARYG